jgi:hypothetical protein
MPNAYPTLLDVAKNDKGSGYAVIDETVERYPELAIFPADTISGLSMELEVLTGLPGGSSFRNVNEGTARTVPTFENRMFQAMQVSRQVGVDLGVVNSSKDRARFLVNRSKPQMQKAMVDIAKQTWYGITGTDASDALIGDAKGFPGLIEQYSPDAQHEVDATGTSAKSSVWLLELGPENIEHLYGQDQTMVMSDEWKEETLYDASNHPYQGLTNWINGRVGLRLANKHRAIRIKNIGTATGKILTDAMLFAALQLAEELNMVPNAIFGTPRSFYQLRAGRTPTNPTGAPVSRLADWEGIPIHYTTNISNNEK